MDKLEYLSIYNTSFNKRKKIISAIYLGDFDIKQFSANHVMAFIEQDINPFTNRREIVIKRFRDYKLEEDRLIIKGYTYYLKSKDSEKEYVMRLLEKRLTKNL